MEPSPPPIPSQEMVMIGNILSQIMSLPLTPNQKEVAKSFVAWVFGKPLDEERKRLFEELFEKR
mgnify:CR=1 FL=1